MSILGDLGFVSSLPPLLMLNLLDSVVKIISPNRFVFLHQKLNFVQLFSVFTFDLPQWASQGKGRKLQDSEMEGDAEARAVLEIIRRNGGPGGNARSSVYSNEYRQDYDNDSSTDEEPMEDNSSDEEEDFVSKYGKISTQTSKRGKVRISNTDGKEDGAAMGEVDSDDDFEADMAVELKERVQAAERDAALTSGQPEDQADDEDIGDLPEGGQGSGPSGPAVKDGKYSDIYFDSDEEEEEASRSGRRDVKSNDELLYDPEKDDEDQVKLTNCICEGTY